MEKPVNFKVMRKKRKARMRARSPKALVRNNFDEKRLNQDFYMF
jgi:hypothetical protein